jgi:predicted Ser/Thr protein kinase
MVSALQQEIRKRGRHSLEISDLVIQEPLGQGGFGKVYKGAWHRRTAAVKVRAGGGAPLCLPSVRAAAH